MEITGKLDGWCEKLLDLGKRNKLISFKDSKQGTIDVLAPSINVAFNKLSSRKTLEVKYLAHKNIEEDEDDNKEEDSLKKVEYAIKSTLDKQLFLHKSGFNTIKVIKSLSKKANDVIQEKGINCLYMSFGMINWCESDNSNLKYKAPIVLIPIKLTNESAISPYFIEQYEDEIIINPTFAYKLKIEYAITLPQYNDEEKISDFLKKVQECLPETWSVEADMKIGMFSFLKMNMYLDIKNNSENILSNPLSKMLVDNEFDESPDTESNAMINYSDKELHNVVDADSSQTEAIQFAKAGKSFVLQGPPGTGKSQTITNIIAECLYDGKKVLFVSEKLAALEVVYKKLEDAGLSDFCLKLHSHNANKKEVIGELNHVLKLHSESISEKAQNELETLEQLKHKLDGYNTELHKKIDVIDLSAFQLYSKYFAINDLPADFTIQNIETKDGNYLKNAIELITSYVDYSNSIGYNYKNNEWYGYKNFDLSFEQQRKTKQILSETLDVINSMVNIQQEILNLLDIDLKSTTMLGIFTKFLDFISEHRFFNNKLFLISEPKRLLPFLEKLYKIEVDLKTYHKELDLIFFPDSYSIDLTKLEHHFSNNSSFFSRITKEYRNSVSSFRSFLRNPKMKTNHKKTLELLQKHICLHNLKIQKLKCQKDVDGFLGSTIEGTISENITLLSQIIKFEEDGLNLSALVNIKNDELFLSFDNYFKQWKNDINSNLSIISDLKLEWEHSWDKNIVNLDKTEIVILKEKAKECLDSIENMSNWISFYRVLITLTELDLNRFIDYAITNNIAIEKFTAVYNKTFHYQWLLKVLSNNTVLQEFNRSSQDTVVRLFQEKDRLRLNIAQAQIRAKLSYMKPNIDIVPAGSPVAFLLREGEKKRKIISVRQMMAKIADLVLTLKPCFMMSPLSVSTFLDSKNNQFDVVVFDEASQIFPQDALGAIYRSKQIIVVGDSKQMPPSNFFMNTDYDEDFSGDDDYDDDISSFDSILEICAFKFQQKRLKWHYRSQSEDLIAFSNWNFYDNELMTFPSVKEKEEGFGVDFSYVHNGFFDRKSKTNRNEAERIADLVVQHYVKNPNCSMGVVAFSRAQQTEIENIIYKKLEDYPEIASLIKTNNKEPFFIKNLETVQGDERDVIILSVGYAKDLQGRFLQNFGPLNKDGGERRLNVAITRAKRNIVLVTSIKHNEINLDRTKSKGSQLLKEYLDFAENGMVALTRTTTYSEDKFDSEFEMDVCKVLRDAGYDVHTQVGCSGYYIDLAIRHPEGGQYILAVECDGATYHSQKSARDRDRLRQEVLERLGWKFYRIWSTDWFKNNKIEKERLLKCVDEIVKNLNSSLTEMGVNADKAELSDFIILDTPAKNIFKKYEIVDINKIRTQLYSSRYNIEAFHHIITQIVQMESPLSIEWLMKRIVFMFDREKITSVVREEFKRLMCGIERKGIVIKNGFAYNKSKLDIVMRAPNAEITETHRDIKYICQEEITNGMCCIIKEYGTVNKEGLFKSMCNYLGFNRIGNAILEAFEKAYSALLKKKAIHLLENGTITL